MYAPYDGVLPDGLVATSGHNVRIRSQPADEALRPGMVTSVETTVLHPTRGFIKLGDRVIVTDTGHEGLGDTARGWTRAGTNWRNAE